MPMKVKVVSLGLGSGRKLMGKGIPFDVGLPDAQDKVFLGQAGAVEVRGRNVRDARQHSEPSTVWALPANPEGSVPCGRAELVNVVEQITVDRICASVGGSEGGAFECRVQVPVMGWSENSEGFGIENRHGVGVGLGDDVLDAVDLVGRMGGRDGEPRHVGCQSYGRVVFFITMGDHSDRAFEEGGEFSEVGLAGVATVEREREFDTILHDG